MDEKEFNRRKEVVENWDDLTDLIDENNEQNIIPAIIEKDGDTIEKIIFMRIGMTEYDDFSKTLDDFLLYWSEKD